jgi:patatin-like phospholipase/acyl hydrolase
MADIKKPVKKIIILDIDGGGVLGLIPLHILKKVEELSGKNCSDIFTAFSGVSTGAIIVAALNMPDDGGEGFKYTATSFSKELPKFLPKIFQRSLWYRIKTLGGLIAPIYEGKAKAAAIESIFGTTTMTQFKKVVSIATSDLNDPSGIIFGVNQYFHLGTLYKGIDFYVKDTVNASTATPIFFPSALTRALNGQKDFNLVDGSVALNTQPLINMTGYMRDNKDAEIHILSLGTHQPNISNYTKVVNWGILKWGTKITELTITGTLRNSVDIVRFIFKEIPQVKQFVRLSPIIPPKIQSIFQSQPKHLEIVTEFAEQFAEECIPQLQQFLDGINGPKAIS